MKIKNLAFYGVMAAILGSVGTARADDSTIIASKGYVDAYAQKKADRVTETWANSTADHGSTTKYPSMATLNDALTTVEGNIQSIGTNALEATGDDVNKLTKASAIKAAATTSVSDSSNAVDTKLPTEKAVADALALKEDTANKQAAQALGANETVTLWDIDENDTSSAAYTSDTKFPTVKAVAQQIAAVDVSAAVQNGTNALELQDATDKAPSVTAVKGIADNRTDDYTTRNASNQLTGSGLTTKVPTTAAVVTALKSLDGLNADGSTGLSAGDDNAQNMEPRRGQPVVKVTQTDGQVKAELGAIGTNGIQDSAVTNLKLANEAVDFRTVSNGTKETSGVARDQTTNEVVKWGTTNNPALPGYASDSKFPTVAAVAQQIAVSAVAPNPNGPISPSLTDHSIVTYNADGLVTGGISLPGLNDINAASGGSSGCDADNPCVLSYYVDKGTKYYKWTKMDIVDLDVVNDTTQSATTGA